MHYGRPRRLVICLLFFSILNSLININYGLYEFPTENDDVSGTECQILDTISSDQWMKSVNFGSSSVDRQKRLELNLLRSQITIQNGSLSHAQLLDTLPNAKARLDSEIALKILKSSIHIYNTICLERGISAKRCNYLLSKKQLPEDSELAGNCKEVLLNRRDGHHSFRRLLPRNYKDGFYAMYSDNHLPLPRAISIKALPSRSVIPEPLDEKLRNLALVQWSQFIEHDLSKPVVTSMSNGNPIECCNKDSYNLLPRYRHTACAPLIGRDESMKHARETCLNYVRSALAIGESCTFGAAEQLNQATGYFDLSQLYGFTKPAQASMRSFKNGRLKSTHSRQIRQELLPTPAEDLHSFCALRQKNSSSYCFMAGDSRVNSNPFTIVIYTVFLRNHNQIAQHLKTQNPDWNDEKLFQSAKSINIDIYRRIIFHEWLPEVLGRDVAEEINTEPITERILFSDLDYHISNEFAVAAIRFYYSMMPNALYNLATINKKEDDSQMPNNNILPDLHIFVLSDQMYTPSLMYSTFKIDEILQSLLHQRAMKMDSTYVQSLIPDAMGNIRPTRADFLAFDIQRGRDHGLQPYYKYVEVCNNLKISSWKDLEHFMSEENLQKLQSAYGNWTMIDLIVGGISETPLHGTVGPTFSCIIGEQFSKIRQWQHLMGSRSEEHLLEPYKSISAAKLLCTNSGLKYIQKNIFQMTSDSNHLISCSDGP